MLRLSASAAGAVRADARDRYPREACGLLLGRDAEGVRHVERAVPVENGWPGDRGGRYRVAPEVLAAVEAGAAREGLAVVGAFHSHPDGAAEPSRFDLEHAWPWYTYLIVPVRAGLPGAPKAWRLAEDRSAFREEGLEEVP